MKDLLNITPAIHVCNFYCKLELEHQSNYNMMDLALSVAFQSPFRPPLNENLAEEITHLQTSGLKLYDVGTV